jgi:hypothetical protein
MPSVPGNVTSTPAQSYQPWDAASEAPHAGWDAVDANSGPADLQGNATGDFESGSGWKQT